MDRLAGAWKCFYFHHIGKTAGTSYKKLLWAEFPKSRICTLKAPCRGILETDLSKFRLFAGHFPFVFHEMLPSPCLTFTTLRDPKSVILSTYNHLYRLNGSHISFSHRSGRPLASFDDFLNDDILRLNSTNPQSHSIAGRLGLAEFTSRMAGIGDIDWRATSGNAARNLSYLLYGEAVSLKLAPELAERAIDVIASEMVCAGIVERQQDSIELLRRISGLPLMKALPRSNRAPANALTMGDLSAAQHRALEKITRSDQKLYDFTNELLNRRLETSSPTAATS
jgi:hypothetical protein